MKEFKSTHNLDFLVAPWIFGGLDPKLKLLEFKVGTCKGLWGSDKKNYFILAIQNSEKGNGHVQDVFEWFYNSCKRDKKNLVILEVWNQRFKERLLKMGFEAKGKDDLIKKLKDIKDPIHGESING